MLIERRVAPFISAVGLALTLPAGAAAFHGFAPRSVTSAGVGAVLGAVGILMGSLVARATSLKPIIAIGIVVWLLVAVAFSGSMFLVAIQQPGFAARAVVLIVALLPLAAWLIPFILPD